MVNVSWCMNKWRQEWLCRFTDEDTEAQRDRHLEVTQAQAWTCKLTFSAF